MPRKAEKSISDILTELGVTRERDPKSRFEDRLYYAGRFIGWYGAHAVGALIREHLTFDTTARPERAVG